MKRFKAFFMVGLGLLALAVAGTPGAAQQPTPAPVLDPAAVQLTPAGNAISYQGYLTDGGKPANGLYDFAFSLYADAAGSQWVTSAQSVADLPVTNGYFLATVDFTDALYGDIHFYLNGEARWLSVAVRPGASTGAFTALTPLQPLTPAPYAQALPGLHTVQNDTSPNVVGGYAWNNVNVNAVGATVGGGGSAGADNAVNDDYGTVSGGADNTAGGAYSTVPGGRSNLADGDYSLAAGRRAQATHAGSFVWADSLDASFSSTANNQFRVRASGGAFIRADNTSAGLIVDGDETAGNGDGLRAYTNHSDAINYAAVYAINVGTSPAIYANSAGSVSAYFAEDIQVVGNCIGCTLVYLAANDGPQPLEEGDVVAATGLAASLAGSAGPVLRVRRVEAGSEEAIAGVVQARGRLVTSAAKEPAEGEIQSVVPAEGQAQPGDYLFVVVQGLARVKADAGAGAIAAGQRLAGSGTLAGHARILQTVTVQGVPLSEGAATLGIALEPLESGTGLIAVLVSQR